MLGHRPKCAQNAAERYAEFPKLRQVDSLRPYLIKYDLFPPRRDPETAPIRMEELKELVRKWNLHQERNFWRHNTTKDDIVRVLYNYKTKLEQNQLGANGKKHDRRASTVHAAGRKNNKSRNWTHTDISDEDHHNILMDAIKDIPLVKSVLTFNMSPPNAVLASWKRRDFFKNNFAFICLCRCVAPDGHGYLRPHQLENESRLFHGKAAKDAATAAGGQGGGGGGSSHSDGDDLSSRSTSTSSFLQQQDVQQQQQPPAAAGGGGGGGGSASMDPNAKVKQTCAVALLNISLRPDAEAIFLDQNGLQDLLNLMASTTDPEVLLHCTASLVNITRNSEGMINLIQSDVVPNLVRVARFDNEHLRQTSALALCQLSSHDGGELWLIQEGAVQGLNNLLHAHNNYTRLVAVQGLINLLTFVSAPRAETITAAIMKIIYNMATIPDEQAQNLCAEALEVLSSFSGVRHLITEAGGVAILSFLMHSGHLGEHAMATCALAIANMSQVKKSRKDMVSMGICSVLISILKIGDRPTKVTCAQALWQLSREQELRESLINDKVLPMLADLLLSGDDELSTLVALNLVNFCADPSCLPLVMREGAGKALVAVLRKGGLDVQKVALQAIVHLVVNVSAFDQLMSYGLVEAMDNLVQVKSHDVALAVTYLSMSRFETARERLAQKGVVSSLLTLSASSDDVTVKTFCLASLQNISTHDKTLSSFKGMGIVQALSATLEMKQRCLRDLLPYQYCAAILVNMSTHEGLCKDMYDDGAVLFLVSLARAGNDLTKYYCTAALYNLSLRHVLTREPGFIAGLVDLTSNHNSARQLLCSKTFANASMNSKGRSAIGSNLSVLVCLCRMLRSTCEDCDKIQYYAALAMCNSLSIYFKKADIEEMVRLNVVNDLAVIMMLRVNEVSTKTILAKALFNLLVREDTRELVDNQDVTQSLLRLMKLQVPELSQICILAVANLSRELDRFGVKLGKIRAVGILLAEGTNRLIGPEVKNLCAHALANLSFEPSCRKAMVREELVMGMRSITATVDGRALEDSAVMFYNLSQDSNCHEGLIEKKAVKLIVHTAHATPLAVVQELCLAALCTLSTNTASHVQLVHDAMPFISHALHTTSTPRVARLDAARLLCNLVTFHDPARKAAVDAKCIAALADLTKTLTEEEDVAMIGKILREISNNEEALPGMLQDGVMNILFKLSKMDPGNIKLDAAHALANLSFCKFRSAMVESGLVETLFWLTLEDCLQYNTPIFQRVSVAFRNVMLVAEGVRTRTIMEDKFLDVLIKVSQYPEDNVQLDAAVAMYHVASHKRTQNLVIKKGILPALIDLADLGHPLIRQICSAAMHTLPPEATDNCNDKRLIKILMTMLHADANKLALVEALADQPKSKLDQDWEPTPGQYKYHRKETKPSWQNHMVDMDLSSRPFAPVHVPLEPPQSSTEGMINTGNLHNVKSTLGEFHKLPLKVDKISPSDLAGPLRGANLVPAKHRASAIGVGGHNGSQRGVTFDYQNGPEEGAIGVGNGTIEEDALPSVGGGGAAVESALSPSVGVSPSGAGRVGGLGSLPRGVTVGQCGGSKVGSTRAPAGPAGHGIIAARDREHHDKYMAELGLPQVVAPHVQQTAVAGSFAGKKGVQRPAVTVLKSTTPREQQHQHQHLPPAASNSKSPGRGGGGHSSTQQQHGGTTTPKASRPRAPAITSPNRAPAASLKMSLEQKILNNYHVLQTADGIEDQLRRQELGR